MPQDTQKQLSFDTGLDAALFLASKGLPVFPLVQDPSDKSFRPLVTEFFDRATTDPDRVAKWWSYVDPTTGTRKDKGYGVAISTTDLMVVDLDNKDGKTGSANFQDTVDLLGLETPQTLTFATPSGGRHLVYRPSAQVSNSASKLADGVDIRGWHGYIATVGTARKDGVYTVVDAADVAPAPACLESAIRSVSKPINRTPKSREKDIVTDHPDDIARAEDFIFTTDTDQYGGYNDTTLRVAMRCGDLGLSQETALELLQDLWVDKPAHRTLNPGELEAIVRNAYNYRAEPLGKETEAFTDQSLEEDFGPPQAGNDNTPADPEDDFSPLAEEEAKIDAQIAERKEKNRRPPYTLIRANNVTVDFSKVDLVDDLLEAGTLAVLYAQSNQGKSLFAMELARCVASGDKFFDREVTQGPVMYVAAEGASSINKRLLGMQTEYDMDIPLFTVPECPDLLTGHKDAARVVDTARQIRDITGRSPSLIIIDTLSRVMAGGNENGPEDMTRAVKHLDLIKEYTGATVLVVHHSGKDQAQGARGHSSLRAATDTEIEINDKVAITTKQRDMETGARIPFLIKSVTIGHNPRGKPVTAAYAVPDTTRDSMFAPDIPLDPTDRTHWPQGVKGDIGFALYCARADHVRPPTPAGWTPAAIVTQINHYLPGANASGNSVRPELRRVTKNDNGFVREGGIDFVIRKAHGFYDLEILSKIVTPAAAPEDDFAPLEPLSFMS